MFLNQDHKYDHRNEGQYPPGRHIAPVNAGFLHVAQEWDGERGRRPLAVPVEHLERARRGDEPVGLGDRKRAEEERVDEAEDGRVGADLDIISDSQ